MDGCELAEASRNLSDLWRAAHATGTDGHANQKSLAATVLICGQHCLRWRFVWGKRNF